MFPPETVFQRVSPAGRVSSLWSKSRDTVLTETLTVLFRLLVLDEMDQLDSKAQDVLYTIFEWPYLPKSRLCLIGKITILSRPSCCFRARFSLPVGHIAVVSFSGIANALDLTDRILPRLQARPHCRPQLLNFPPYSRQELVAIVQDRLAQVEKEK